MKTCMMILAGTLVFSNVFAQVVDLTTIRIINEPVNNYEDASFTGSPVYLADDISGVDIQGYTGFGFLQDVSIRGGIFEDARVRLNGIPLDNPQTGHYNLSLPVVSTDIHAIDADLSRQMLGFNLKFPTRETSFVRMTGGNRGFAESIVSTTRKINGTFHRFSIEGMRTDGLRDETDGYRTAASYMLSRKGVEDDFFLYAAVAEKKFGVSGAYAAPWYMREEEQIKQEFVTGAWTLHRKFDISIRPYFHRTQDRFLLDRDNPSFYRNDHTTFVTGNILELYDPETGGYGLFEFQRDDIRSTNLGIHQRFSYAVETGVKTRHLGRWRYEAGVKAKYFDQYPLELMPHFGVGYQLTNFWQATLKGNRMYRQPSFTELYYHSPSNIANPDLELQRSDNIEIGVAYQTGELSFKTDVFYRHQKNTIDWVRNIGDTVFRAVNAGEVNVRGFDVGIGAPVDFLIFNSVDLTYTRLDVNKEKIYDVSKYVFDYLRDRAVLRFSGLQGKWSYSLRSVFEYHIDLGERIIFSVDGDYQLGNDARVFASVENLFNTHYEEFRYLQGEPLFIKAGLELRF